MEEGRMKTILLRRPRAAGPARRVGGLQRWRDAVGVGASMLFTPPRQVWLAMLGGTALTLRAAQTGWARVVAEGEAAERWLRSVRGSTPAPQG